MKRTTLAAFLVLLLSSAVSAGNLPNTFTSGTPAKAAEVNANFTYLEDLINTLSNQLANQAVPPGTVVAFAGATPPEGWLLCDGSAVSRTTYADLYAVIGNTHGRGDNVSTFNKPDYRGRFLRGVDGTAGLDPNKSDAERPPMNTGGNTGNNVGSVQGDEFKSHTHVFTTYRANGAFDRSGVGRFSDYDTSNSNSVSYSGGGETRPKNAYVNFIIKF